MLSARGKDARTGIHYISPADSVLEYTELTGADMVKLTDSILGLNEYDALILDLSSEFSQEKAEILRNCDLIFVPLVQDDFSIYRMEILLREDSLHGEYNSLIKRMRLVLNKADASGVGPALQNSGILNRLPLTAAVSMSPMFMNQANLLRAAEASGMVFAPLVREIQGV